MPALQLGISLSALRLPLRRALPLLAEWRVPYLELDARQEFRPADFGPSAIRQLRKLLADHSMQIGGVAYPTRRSYCDQTELDARIAGTKAACKFAADLGCRIVTGQIGLIPSEADSVEGRLLSDVLNEIGRASERYGVTFCAQTTQHTAVEWSGLLSRLPPATLGLDFCPAILNQTGLSAIELLEQCAADVRHVRIQDSIRGLGRAQGKLTSLGNGSVDWPELLGLLQERNYRGHYTLDTSGSEDPASDAEVGLAYIRRL